jgi:hypothetical protein
MNTKFKRDKYGLQLQLIPANDDERALLAELVDVLPGRPRGLNLNVMKEINDEVCSSIFLMHGGFINRSALIGLGWSTPEGKFNDGVLIMFRNVENEIQVVVGTYHFYVWTIVPVTEFFTIESAGKDISIVYNDADGNYLESKYYDRNTAKKVRNIYELQKQMI